MRMSQIVVNYNIIFRNPREIAFLQNSEKAFMIGPSLLA